MRHWESARNARTPFGRPRPRSRRSPAADSRRSGPPSRASRPPRTRPAARRSIRCVVESREGNAAGGRDRPVEGLQAGQAQGRRLDEPRRAPRDRSAGPCSPSRSSAISSGDSPAALRRKVEVDWPLRGTARRLTRDWRVISGRRSTLQGRLAVPLDGIAQGRRQRIDGAAFEPIRRHHRLAPHRDAAEGQRDALERLALEPGAQQVGPGHLHAHIGGPQPRDRRRRAPREAAPRRRRSRDAASSRRRAPGRPHRARSRDGLAVSVRRKCRSPASSQPCQRCRRAKATPSDSSRRSHARSSGEALKALGKTRPLEPTKVSWPRPSLQRRSAAGGKASMAGRRCGSASPKRSTNCARSSLWVRLRPPRPAMSSLRPTDGIRS